MASPPCGEGPPALPERYAGVVRKTFMDYQATEAWLESPLIVARAEGVYYWDVNGKRYVDAIAGIYACSLGHRPAAVIDAVRRQMDRLTFSPPMHGVSDVALDFVDRLGRVTPRPAEGGKEEHLTFVKTFSGGSEAMESAIKFTRQYHKQTGRPGKHKFVSRYFGYHGGTLGATSASGTGPRKSPFEPLMPGFVKVFPPTHYRDRLPAGTSWEEVNRFAARSIEDTIVAEDPDTVAGVIVEPIGNTGGVITPTDEYFRIIRDACDRHGVTLIFDEVITGFGRTGEMFAAQTFGVVPDIIVCGKGLSAGMMPLAAMIARQRMGDAFHQRPGEAPRFFAHGHTYANSPMACAVGIAVLDEFERLGLCERARALGARLRGHFEGLKRYGVVREVRGRGLFLGVELVRDASLPPDQMRPYPELGAAMKRAVLANGLMLRVDQTWFAAGPALTSTDAEIDEMARLIEKSLADALRAVRGGAALSAAPAGAAATGPPTQQRQGTKRPHDADAAVNEG